MIVSLTGTNPAIEKKAKEKYKRWSREKFLEAAIAATHPEHPHGKGTLQAEFTCTVEIDEGGSLGCKYMASLVETRSSFFSVLIHEFTPEESRVIKAQKIYWEMVQRFRRAKR